MHVRLCDTRRGTLPLDHDHGSFQPLLLDFWQRLSGYIDMTFRSNYRRYFRGSSGAVTHHQNESFCSNSTSILNQLHIQ
jgi:hypothetical protein